jgi:hypothetical protein
MLSGAVNLSGSLWTAFPGQAIIFSLISVETRMISDQATVRLNAGAA